MNQKEHSPKTDNQYSESSFDLDAYIAEQSQENEELSEKEESTRRYRIKNMVLIFGLMIASFLWYHDWSPAQAYSAVFGSDEENITVGSNFVPVAPDIPNFDIPTLPDAPLIENLPGGSPEFLDYMANLKDAGIEFSMPGMRALHGANVPIEYISAMRNEGYLELFSYPAIVALYSGNVSIDFLNTLSNNYLLEDFSYPGLVALYNGDVNFGYLNALKEEQFLEKFSYPAIVALYNSDVPVEFLLILKERNLLDDMSYPEIISAYNADN